MREIVLFVTALLLTSGCICCSTDVFNKLGGNETTTTVLPPTTTTNTEEQITPTTLAATATTLPVNQTTEATATTTTIKTSSITECLGRKGIDSDEVVFLYTTSCCAPIERTVSQLGSYKFKKYEVGIAIKGDEKDVLNCLGLDMEEAKTMQSAQFWCPASGEQMVVPKEKFIGASDSIKEFAVKCRQKAVENG